MQLSLSDRQISEKRREGTEGQLLFAVAIAAEAVGVGHRFFPDSPGRCDR